MANRPGCGAVAGYRRAADGRLRNWRIRIAAGAVPANAFAVFPLIPPYKPAPLIVRWLDQLSGGICLSAGAFTEATPGRGGCREGRPEGWVQTDIFPKQTENPTAMGECYV